MMSTTAAEGEKKLGKVEAIKVRSNYLVDPLKEVIFHLFAFILIVWMLFSCMYSFIYLCRKCRMKKYLCRLMLSLY